MPQLPPLPQIRQQVARALAEDVGSGDLTASLLPAQAQAVGEVWCRESAVLCGSAWFNEVFHQLDPATAVAWQVHDGERVAAESLLCTVRGSARTLLTGERTALNLLQTLSATATTAARYAAAVATTEVTLLDTRKTIPGLRLAQKYAVACGGCHNHRVGLYDAILIKENHIIAAGSIAAALQCAFSTHPGVEVEIEVENLEELQQALQAGAKRILLDNFSLEQLRQAVAINQRRARLEASGSLSLEQLPAIAATGVDDISIGALTKHLTAIDLSMRFTINPDRPGNSHTSSIQHVNLPPSKP